MPTSSTFATRLLAWFDAHRRDLPWRRTRSPWAIWVSEVMLQQTRVEAVRSSFERFLARYPRPADFAGIGDDELHAAWRGLGYYRRARLLRDAAAVVVREHGGEVPADPALLASLPGVGAYTQGAVASIAFGVALPAIDGNVERVIARHRLLRAPVKQAATQREIKATVEGWLDRRRPGDFNQALMELGAMVCTPGQPRCGACPVADDCQGRRAGAAADLPRRPTPRAAVDVAAHALVVFRGPHVVAFRIPAGEPNAGQYELPGPGVLQSVDPADIARLTRRRCGVALRVGAELATVRHAITHHRIRLTAHAAAGAARGLQAFAIDDPQVPWTTISRKVFRAVHGAMDP